MINKPMYLLPFIYLYKMMMVIFALPFRLVEWFLKGLFVVSKKFLFIILKLLKYIWNGIFVISFYVYKVFKYFIYGIFFLPVFLIRKINNRVKISPEEKEKRKQEEEARRLMIAKEKERLAQEEERRKQELIEIGRKKQAEIIEERKRQKEKDTYVNENVTLEKKKVSDYINSFFLMLGSGPKKLKEYIIDKYSNSSLVKNRKNTEDIKREALLISFEGEDAEKSNNKKLYQYVAKNPEGKIVKGDFEAFSKTEVHSFLLSDGYEVYSINVASNLYKFLNSATSVNKQKIATKDLIFFTTQLSTYLKAGIQLVDSLRILDKQFNNKAYKRIFKGIMYDLTMGDNFSDALEKQGTAFPKLYINMIKASEMTGQLPEALDDMEQYYTEAEATRKQMVTAMMYPSIVLVFAIGVIVFILVFVIPKFVDIYNSMDAEIPGITRFILNASGFLKNNYFWLIISITAFVLIYVYLYKNVKTFKTMIQWINMHIPIIKNIVIYNEVTMFTKTFASLLSHNVFITDSMEILTKITSNEIYKMIILDTITNLARGDKISKAFQNHWAVPEPAYEMIVTGEKTGQLPEMMSKVSEYYQEMHKNAVARIKTFIEPAMIVFLAGIVGLIILSIVVPMFSMYTSVMK